MEVTSGKTPFPPPSEIETPPGAEGWQSMYPYYTRFQPEDDGRFWFYNAMHFPEPMPAFDAITAEVPYTAIGANTTRIFCFPTTLGIEHRIVNGRVYITAILVLDPAEVQRRLAVFQERAGYYFENWDRLYAGWKVRMEGLIREIEGIRVPELPELEDSGVVTGSTGVAQNHFVRERFHRCIDLYSMMWHHHTELLMLGYGAYVTFFEFCKQAFPEIPDQMVARMVAGVDVIMYRPDDELLSGSRADHEAVVLCEQPHHVPRRLGRLVEVGGEHPAAPPRNVDLRDLVPELGEQLARGGRPGGEPASELLRRGGSVGGQEAAQHPQQRHAGIVRVPVADPLVRADERHLRAAARPKAQRPGQRRRCQQVAPGRRQPLARPAAHPLRHGLGELLAGEPLPVQRLPGRRHQLIDPLGGDIRQLVPHRPAMVGDRLQGGHPHRQLPGREQVQRAARPVGLHQGAPLPELVAHVLLGDAVDPRADRQLSRAHHLRLDPAHLADDSHQALARRRGEQVAARQPPRADLVPREGAHWRMVAGDPGHRFEVPGGTDRTARQWAP